MALSPAGKEGKNLKGFDDSKHRLRYSHVGTLDHMVMFSDAASHLVAKGAEWEAIIRHVASDSLEARHCLQRLQLHKAPGEKIEQYLVHLSKSCLHAFWKTITKTKCDWLLPNRPWHGQTVKAVLTTITCQPRVKKDSIDAGIAL